MGVFDGISDDQVNNAKPIEQTDRLEGEGLYILAMRTTKFTTSNNVKNKTDGWPLFNAEFTVLENTGGVPMGATRSWGMLIDPGQSTSSKQDADRQIGDVKKFVAAAAASPNIKGWKDVKSEHLMSVKNNPLKLEGKRLIAEVRPVKRSQRGNDFHPIDFRPYTEEEGTRIKGAMSSTPAPTQPPLAGKKESTPTTPTQTTDDEVW